MVLKSENDRLKLNVLKLIEVSNDPQNTTLLQFAIEDKNPAIKRMSQAILAQSKKVPEL
jgi:hypothetical protein